MISFDTGSLNATILQIKNLQVTERAAARSAVGTAGKTLKAAIRRNMMLQDHSLEDLARLDHPYARRHGSIQIHTSGSRNLTHPEFRIHRQSGRMLRALDGGLVSASGGRGPSYMVWVDAGRAPHAAYVIQGTRVMLGRDMLWSTAMDKRVRKRLMQTILRILGSGLRAQAVVRFGSKDRPALPGGALEV